MHDAGRHNYRFSWSEMAYDVPNPHAQRALDNFECLLLDPVPVGGRSGQP